jgi:AcrR family transcriptional regulator
MGERLDRIEETRRRIAHAAFELHSTLGPARTSISAIAERAGVQRHTVYHHYPDLVSLFRACTEHGIRLLQPPDAQTWRAVPDPVQRVQCALGELYPYYRQNARLIGNVIRDMAVLPELVEGSQRFFDLAEAWFDALADGWPPDVPQRPALEAALHHALDFGTWESLTRQGMTDEEARDAMTSFVTVMADGPRATSASRDGR